MGLGWLIKLVATEPFTEGDMNGCGEIWWGYRVCKGNPWLASHIAQM